MLSKNRFLDTHPGFREGMRVKSRDGEALGEVLTMDEEYFTIEKGVSLLKDFSVSYEDVEIILDDEVVLSFTMNEAEELKSPYYKSLDEIAQINRGEMRDASSDESVSMSFGEKGLESKEERKRKAG